MPGPKLGAASLIINSPRESGDCLIKTKSASSPGVWGLGGNPIMETAAFAVSERGLFEHLKSAGGTL